MIDFDQSGLSMHILNVDTLDAQMPEATGMARGIRVSTHFYDDDEDLDRLLWVMGRLLGAARTGR